jgi:hypothetical protein
MDITKILGYGLSGLCFLLFVLSFRLISQEQKQTAPRKPIMQIIVFFMVLALISTISVGWLGIVQMNKNDELAALNKNLYKRQELQNDNVKGDEIIHTLDTLPRAPMNLQAKKATLVAKASEFKAESDTLVQQLADLDPEQVGKAREEQDKISKLVTTLQAIPVTDTLQFRKIKNELTLHNERVKEIRKDAIERQVEKFDMKALRKSQ